MTEMVAHYRALPVRHVATLRHAQMSWYIVHLHKLCLILNGDLQAVPDGKQTMPTYKQVFSTRSLARLC